MVEPRNALKLGKEWDNEALLKGPGGVRSLWLLLFIIIQDFVFLSKGIELHKQYLICSLYIISPIWKNSAKQCFIASHLDQKTSSMLCD